MTAALPTGSRGHPTLLMTPSGKEVKVGYPGLSRVSPPGGEQQGLPSHVTSLGVPSQQCLGALEGPSHGPIEVEASRPPSGETGSHCDSCDPKQTPVAS